jgi:2-polyprenyl-3-methyl-5-hydroxy-6-metoxy-1,4-benzoquinol methylase
MKILVAIASYGTCNDVYLRQLLDEYSTMPHELNIVVMSNIEKKLGPNIKVVEGLPSRNPWSLPFAHKAIFEKHLRDHDLFIYSEDDTLITEANIAAFLWATSVLEPGEIAGFIRSEQSSDNSLYYSTIHNHYHWDVGSVCRRQDETFAHFTNEHSACYMLTQEQLRRAITSGGFCVPPHEGKYDLLVSAATDPYTQCGLKKLVCISRLAQFTCKHLTNKYIGRTGICAEMLQIQIDALLEMDHSKLDTAVSMRVEPSLPGTRWIKSYYEPCRDDLLSLVPASARKVLSVGCGWGDTEEALLERNINVTAIPLDIVIGRVAQARGLRVVPCLLGEAPMHLAGESFDVILISGLLHLVDDPMALLRGFKALLNPGGLVIASFPNVNHASVWWRRLIQAPAVQGLNDFRHSGMHMTSLPRVTQWLQSAGYRVETSNSVIGGRWSRYDRATLGMLGGLWASDYCITASSLATPTHASTEAEALPIGVGGRQSMRPTP